MRRAARACAVGCPCSARARLLAAHPAPCRRGAFLDVSKTPAALALSRPQPSLGRRTEWRSDLPPRRWRRTLLGVPPSHLAPTASHCGPPSLSRVAQGATTPLFGSQALTTPTGNGSMAANKKDRPPFSVAVLAFAVVSSEQIPSGVSTTPIWAALSVFGETSGPFFSQRPYHNVIGYAALAAYPIGGRTGGRGPRRVPPCGRDALQGCTVAGRRAAAPPPACPYPPLYICYTGRAYKHLGL